MEEESKGLGDEGEESRSEDNEGEPEQADPVGTERPEEEKEWRQGGQPAEEAQARGSPTATSPRDAIEGQNTTGLLEEDPEPNIKENDQLKNGLRTT